MPTHNVEELFHQFMQDPEYIGKEELALAEAKQRVIQSMNNHKALSMAKMDSPLDDLTNFLLQKGDNDFWHHKTGHKGPSHIVSTEVKETTFEELLDHAKEELLALTPKGTTWEQLTSDPEKVMSYFETAREQGILTDKETYMTNLLGGFAGRGAIQGILPDREDPNPDAFRREIPKGHDAIDELGKRALDNTSAARKVERLKEHIRFFNLNQQNSAVASEAVQGQDPGERSMSFAALHGAGAFVPARGTPDGEIFSPDPAKWKSALTEVMSPNNDWSAAGSGWKDQVVTNARNDRERSAAAIQSDVISLVHTLTGKLYENPKDALGVIRDIHSRPEQFMARDDDGVAKMRRATDTGTGDKTFVPNIKSSDSQEFEKTSHDALSTIAQQITSIEQSRDSFFHHPVPQRQEYNQAMTAEQEVDDPQGKGWYHHQPLSPTQRWILENAYHPDDNISDRAAQTNLIGEILRRYNRTQDYDLNTEGTSIPRDAHGTAKGLENLIADVVREQGLQVPPATTEVMDEQAEWPLEHTYNRVATKDPRIPAPQLGAKETIVPGEVNITPVKESLNPEVLGGKTPDQLAYMLDAGEISENEYLGEVHSRWNTDPKSLLEWEGHKVFFNEDGNNMLVDRDNQSGLSAMTRLDAATGKIWEKTPQFTDPEEMVQSELTAPSGRWSPGRGGNNLANVKLAEAVNVKNVGTSDRHWENHDGVADAVARGEGVSLVGNGEGGNEHYASPFTFKDALDKDSSLYNPDYGDDYASPANTVFSTPEEATEAYDSWLRGTDYGSVEPERRKWILEQIHSGELDDKNLLYHTDEHNQSGRDTDADVLAHYINSADGANRHKLSYGLADTDDYTEIDSVGSTPKELALRLGQRPMPEIPPHLYDNVTAGHVGLLDEPTHTQYGGAGTIGPASVSMNLGYEQRGNIPFDKLGGLGDIYKAPLFDGEEDLKVNRDELQNYLHHRNFIGQMLQLGIPIESLTNGLKDGTRQWSMDAMERGMQDHGLLQHGETIFQRNFRPPGQAPSGRPKNIMNAGVPPIFPKTGRMPGADGKSRGNPAQARRNAIKSNLSPEDRASLQKDMEKEWIAIHGGTKGFKKEDPPRQNIEYPYHWDDDIKGSKTFGQRIGEDPPDTSTGSARPRLSEPAPTREYNATKPNYTTNEGGMRTSQYLDHVIREEVKRKGREGQPDAKYDGEGNRIYDRQQDFSPHTGLPISDGDNFDKEYAATEKKFVDEGGVMPTPPRKIDGAWDPAELAVYRAKVVQALGPNPRKVYENSLRDGFEQEYKGKEVDYNHVMEHFQGKDIDVPHPSTLPMGQNLVESLPEVGPQIGPRLPKDPNASTSRFTSYASYATIREKLLAGKTTAGDLSSAVEDLNEQDETDPTLDTVLAAIAAINTDNPETAITPEQTKQLLDVVPNATQSLEEYTAPKQRQPYAGTGEPTTYGDEDRDLDAPQDQDSLSALDAYNQRQNTPATEDEQPSGEQDTPQKFVNTHQPNNLADVKEWGDQIAAAEEEKGRPLSDEEKADLRENIDGKGWINNPNYVEPEETPSDTEEAPAAEQPQFVNHSGGAQGADSAWDDIGQEFGVESNHYHMGGKWHPTENATEAGHRHTHDVVRTPEEHAEIDAQLEHVGNVLQNSRWPDKEGVARNYFRRNVEQVKQSDAIFAIGKLTSDQSQVAGGTGWAVEYAKQFDSDKPIHVYDLDSQSWKMWDAESKTFITNPEGTPTLTPNFAGIGSRGSESEVTDAHPQAGKKYAMDIPEHAKQAMKDVYEKTLKDTGRENLGGTPATEETPAEETPTAEAEKNEFDKHIADIDAYQDRLRTDGKDITDEEIKAYHDSLDYVKNAMGDSAIKNTYREAAGERVQEGHETMQNWHGDDDPRKRAFVRPEASDEEPAAEEAVTPEETTGGTTPPTPPTPPTAEAEEEAEDDDSEEEDQEALEAEQKKAAKEELDRNNQIVIDTHKGIDAGKSFTPSPHIFYRMCALCSCTEA